MTQSSYRPIIGKHTVKTYSMGDFWFGIAFVLIFSTLYVLRVICKRRTKAAHEGLFPKKPALNKGEQV